MSIFYIQNRCLILSTATVVENGLDFASSFKFIFNLVQCWFYVAVSTYFGIVRTFVLFLWVHLHRPAKTFIMRYFKLILLSVKLCLNAPNAEGWEGEGGGEKQGT